MKDPCKTKKQLVEEVEVLRKQLVKLKKAETKRRRVEETLKTTNERLNYLLTSTSAAIYTAKTSGDYAATSVTENIKQITGYEPREFIENSGFWIDHVHPEDKERILKELPGIFEQGSYIYEYRFLYRDGNYSWVRDDMKLIRDKFGNPVEIIGYWIDITERKQAEEKLRESEERYRSLFENSDDAILLTVPDGGILQANPSACRMFGRTEVEITRMGRNGVVDTTDPRLLIALEERKRTGKFRGELRFLRRDGRPFPGELTSVVFRGKGGQPRSSMIIRDITERKQAEDALRESEERYRRLVDNSLMGIGISCGNQVVFANSALLRLFGYDDLGEFIQIPLLNHVAPTSHELIAARMEKIAQGEPVPVEFEYDILRKDGLTKTLLASSQHFTLGGKTYSQTTFQDITDRKQAEEALRQSEERYRTILENTEEGYYEVNLAGNFTFFNDSMWRIYGYPKEELMVMNYRQYTDPETAKKVFQTYNHIYRTGEPGRVFDYPIIRKDKTVRYVEASISLQKDSSGKPIGFRGIVRDITDRKHAEEALRQSEERYRTILEDIEEGYFEVDLAGRSTFLNDSMCKIHGYPREELLGTDNRWFVDKENAKRAFEAFNQIYRTGEPGRVFDYEIMRKDGTKRQVDVFGSLRKDPSGNPIGFRGIVRDMTERKRVEKEKAELQEQLRQSQKMEAIGRLAGGIAHDFNNLLTVIKGYSQLSLIELKEDTPLKGNIEHIHTATDRAADLVRQLLAFSRRQILEMKVWDLNAILTNLKNMLRRLIGEDIELTTILAEDLGRVKTDLGWIEQAIMNLVVNARDAMPSGGKLTIETANVVLDEAYVSRRVGVKPGPFVMFSVSDTGVGMTPEVRERLFEPFFSTKEKDKGTGLGLSTVYGIVKQSGGNIWVYSEPGKGTTFKIYLPRVDEPLEQLREKASADRLLRGSETILLVEDEEDVRRLAHLILGRQGYEVLAARDGDEALLICGQHKDPIHLLLTDVVMPRMSGHELAKRLESSHPEAKVLYMSGYTDNAIVLHGVLAEGVNYIQKPFTVDALTKKVREVLER